MAMVDNEVQGHLEAVVKEILTPLGFDLVEAKYIRANRDIIVRLLIDRLEGGITLEECTQLNKRIGAALDEKHIMNEPCTLEVSSPGLDRFLTEPKDFRRALNRPILVFLKDGNEGTRQREGILKRVEEAGIALIDKDGNETFLAFAAIHKAKQVII